MCKVLIRIKKKTHGKTAWCRKSEKEGILSWRSTSRLCFEWHHFFLPRKPMRAYGLSSLHIETLRNSGSKNNRGEKQKRHLGNPGMAWPHVCPGVELPKTNSGRAGAALPHLTRTDWNGVPDDDICGQIESNRIIQKKSPLSQKTSMIQSHLIRIISHTN